MNQIRPHYLVKLDVLKAIILEKFYDGEVIPSNVSEALEKLHNGGIIQDLAVSLSMQENGNVQGLKQMFLAIAGIRIKEPAPPPTKRKIITALEGDVLKRNLLDNIAPHLNISLDKEIVDLIESTYDGNALDNMQTEILKHFLKHNSPEGLYSKLKQIRSQID